MHFLFGFIAGALLFLPSQSAPPEPPILIHLSTPPLSVAVQPVTLYVTSTGYSSTRDQTDATPFVTATGTKVRHGVLAVSPDLLRTLPFGTNVEIEGQQYVVEDVTHPRWRNTVDIWFPSRGAATRWGRKPVEMKILTIPKRKGG